MPTRNSRRQTSNLGGTGCACTALRKAARAVTVMYDETVRPSGLRSTQLQMLRAVAGSPSITVTRLAKETVTDRTTLTRNLRLLERRRLIKLKSGDDRREKWASITAGGRHALRQAYPLWEKAQGRIVNSMGLGRWTALRAELAALVELARD